MRTADGWYPEGEAYRRATLDVGDGHVIAYEEYGNPEGLIAVSLHGGPGAGFSTRQRRSYDPQRWRVISFDQRGCGASTPFASLEHNTTWDLVADIERLREHLGIDTWVVEGGSWGSTLALTYAITHPARVQALLLRGIFLVRDADIAWFYQSGANALFPDVWRDYVEFIPEAERHDLLSAYRRRLDDPDPNVRLEAARRFAGWEVACLFLVPRPEIVAEMSVDDHLVSVGQIENHYFVHHGFFDHPDWICAHAAALADIPIEIVHGRYDVVCPIVQAFDLVSAAPHANLVVVPDAGHSSGEPGISRALADAADRLAQRLAGGANH